MTIDRAIEILDPEHRENYDGLDEVNEACRMGMEALERTRWIPCSERMPGTNGKDVSYLVYVPSFGAVDWHYLTRNEANYIADIARIISDSERRRRKPWSTTIATSVVSAAPTATPPVPTAASIT